MAEEVHFEDQGGEFGRPPQRAAGVDFTGKLVRWGIVSDRKQAEYILIGIAVLVVVVAIVVFRSASG